jgi:hypothetical protein
MWYGLSTTHPTWGYLIDAIDANLLLVCPCIFMSIADTHQALELAAAAAVVVFAKRHAKQVRPTSRGCAFSHDSDLCC